MKRAAKIRTTSIHWSTATTAYASMLSSMVSMNVSCASALQNDNVLKAQRIYEHSMFGLNNILKRFSVFSP
jgi:hypothetical protein